MISKKMVWIMKWYCVIGILLWCVNRIPCIACAKELPAEVEKVENEEVMIHKLIKGMRQHKTFFLFYYDGIEKDFVKYQKQSLVCQDFLDKLAREDGYLMGIVSGSCICVCGSDQKYVTFQWGYLTTKKQERKIERKLKRFVRKFNKGSRLERIRKAHDYLLDHMRYDSSYYSPYDAFMKGKGMCMGYALAFQRLMQEMGIPCIYVKVKNHAWNMVKIGDYWYNIDVTWDDSGNNSYRYFLKSDTDFPGHERPKEKKYQSLRKARRSYPF